MFPKSTTSSIERTCVQCGKIFHVYPSQLRYRNVGCCNRECADLFRHKHVLRHFWDKIAAGGPDECWQWLGGTRRDGYGVFVLCGFRHIEERAHRFMYSLVHSGIPDGLYVLHTCDNPPCVNPNHLYAGTQLDNMHDCIARNRRPQYYLEPMLGSDHPNSKLTTGDVLTIRARREAGEKLSVIARDFPISRTTAGLICQRKAWKHV